VCQCGRIRFRGCCARRAGHIKKALAAQEVERADVAKRRRRWLRWIVPWLCQRLPHLLFIDETAVSTRMARLRGRAVRGSRLRARAPFAKWGTQTFVAALCADRLAAPWVIPGAMDRIAFDLYVQTQLVPTLRPGDIVVLDNLSVHKSPKAMAAIRACGARMLFLPQYSPDLNPIEMAFAKLKAHLRAAAARTQTNPRCRTDSRLRPVSASRMSKLLQSRRVCVRITDDAFNKRRFQVTNADYRPARMTWRAK